MYPSDDKGKITGKPEGMKTKLDSGAGANMSLSTYTSINTSDFDKEGNPTGNFQRSSTGLKSFGGRQIQQYGIKTIKCVWEKKLWLLNFHIVDAEEPILIGLGTILKLDMIQFHPQVHISSIDINAIRPRLARQGKKDAEIDVMSKTNDNDFVSEWLEDDNEVIDITTGWHEEKDTKMYDSNNANILSIVRGPRYIHPESDLLSRPTINSKADLKEMYPEHFGGVGMFKNFEYEIKLDPKVKPVVHAPRTVPFALQP